MICYIVNFVLKDYFSRLCVQKGTNNICLIAIFKRFAIFYIEIHYGYMIAVGCDAEVVDMVYMAKLFSTIF